MLRGQVAGRIVVSRMVKAGRRYADLLLLLAREKKFEEDIVIGWKVGPMEGVKRYFCKNGTNTDIILPRRYFTESRQNRHPVHCTECTTVHGMQRAGNNGTPESKMSKI